MKKLVRDIDSETIFYDDELEKAKKYYSTPDANTLEEIADMWNSENSGNAVGELLVVDLDTLKKITTLFEVATTFEGDWVATEYYFDTKEKAETFLAEQENGDISVVTIASDHNLDYSDGCSWNDLVFGGAIETKIIKEV